MPLTIEEKIAQLQAKAVEVNTAIATKKETLEQRQGVTRTLADSIQILEAKLAGIQAALAELMS